MAKRESTGTTSTVNQNGRVFSSAVPYYSLFFFQFAILWSLFFDKQTSQQKRGERKRPLLSLMLPLSSVTTHTRCASVAAHSTHLAQEKGVEVTKHHEAKTAAAKNAAPSQPPPIYVESSKKKKKKEQTHTRTPPTTAKKQ
jgi:hypothetical protein